MLKNTVWLVDSSHRRHDHRATRDESNGLSAHLCLVLELGDSLCALRNSVLGELSRKKEADSSLDLARRKSGLLGVTRELGGLKGEALEDVVDEGVQDGHTSLGDTSVGVDLLQDLVDVRRVGLSALAALLLAIPSLLGGLGGFLSDGWCLCHCVWCEVVVWFDYDGILELISFHRSAEAERGRERGTRGRERGRGRGRRRNEEEER